VLAVLAVLVVFCAAHPSLDHDEWRNDTAGQSAVRSIAAYMS
jgi:hypothetical protein